MENNQINGSNSFNKNYKYILTAIAITALASSTTYLLFQNNRQKKIVQGHARAINELQSVISNNRLTVNFNDYLNSVFNDRRFSFPKFFSDMENQMSEFRHGFYENNRNGIVKTVVDEQEYKITAALPGFSKEEIAVKLSGNNLEINAKHVTQDNSDNADNKDTGVKKPKDEIKYTVSIPADIDRSNITAQLNNGILTIKFSRIMDQTPIETKEILID